MKAYNRKNLFLFGIMNLFIVFNVYGVIALQKNPISAPNYNRTNAEYGNIEITKSGETENLGYIDDDQISLCWFIHITDLHLSASNIEYYHNFERFLEFSYENIHPFTTIATGDLQNGQKVDNFYDLEGKVREDYLRYFEAVNSSKYSNDSNPYRYVEVSGNHDRNLDWG